jgi:uncharacterized phage protein gp47/JayE
MDTPKFLGPDGTLRERLVFSTTVTSRFFQGVISGDTAEMEVSIGGAPFTTDPDLITFEGTSFTVPNPASYPDGLDLSAGENIIIVRSISTNNSISAPASAEANLVQEGNIGFIPTPPTNITVERLDGKIRLQVEAINNSQAVSYNFYASQFPGGGVTGYSRINLNAILPSGEPENVYTSIGNLTVDSDVPVDANGNPTVDPLFYNVLGQQIDSNGDLVQSDFNEVLPLNEDVTKIRTTVNVSSVVQTSFVYFDHIRSGRETSNPQTIPNGDFASTPSEQPLYYVVTAIYFDPQLNLEIESSQSIEVFGNPVTVTSNLGSFPTVGQDQVVTSIIESIIRVEPQIKVEPGSVLRDTVIDPVSDEILRVRLIADYVHRAQSFPTLLEIDDPSGSGVSLPVEESSYKTALKQAFFLSSDEDVQNMIDLTFDRLASRFAVTRKLGIRAQGEVTFFTTRRPSATINIPIGTTVSGGTISFRTTQFARIPFENLASFFDPTTGRYSVNVQIQAEIEGSSGNVARGQIRQVVGGSSSSLSVINNSATFGGTDLESNLSLSTRAQNRIASVDTGTRRGYLQVAAEVPGVVKAQVIEAGDPLMQRDFDPTTGEHRGGKVDIWVQGGQEGVVSDTFAFSFDTARDIQFELTSQPEDYIFRSEDERLSETNPIDQMLDFESLGLGLRNASTGEFFDLTNYQLLTFNTIQLSTAIPQPPVSLTDVVLGDYRLRTGTDFVFTRQPVNDVLTVEGSQSGTLDPSIYELVRPNDPLQEGRSILAGDFLQINDPGDGTGPSGNPIDVAGETHVIIGENLEYVDNLGANPLTVVVYNEDRTIQYRGPYDPSGVSDYTIVNGDQTTPLAIRRILSGNIASGETVSMDYTHSENFTVSYAINQIPQAVQNEVDDMRHITADVLAKEALVSPVNISATIVLDRGESPSTVDSRIRTDLNSYVTGLRLGDPLRLSDVIAIIEPIRGVSFVVLESLEMYLSEGAQILRESLSTGQIGDSTLISAWSNTINGTWLIEEELNAATTTGGGPITEFRGVFRDDFETQLEIVRPDLLSQGEFRSFIIGDDGLNIPGYSDDQTLESQGYITEEEKATRRREITKNRVLLSLKVGDSPTNYQITTTYIVGVDSGPKNVDPGPSEVLSLGDVLFTYDEDR